MKDPRYELPKGFKWVERREPSRDLLPIVIKQTDIPTDHKPVSLTNIVVGMNRLASSVRSVRR